MFREIREIKNKELREEYKKKEEFKKIKPKTNITIDEARRFVESLFLVEEST